ncbi:zinc finger protein 33A-like [Bradysia coprophila]|uniref:zinc finger protein 33A-like n=1 Tax=Bradysia coprophila TaxID=38358 RepID=UPI00187D9E11|nr:zinc finger protein 33A-like [Bradysia coprophila]
MDLSSLPDQKCCICDNSVESENSNIFEVVSGHSQTPVHLFMEKFLGHSLSSRTETNFSNQLCQHCIDKFNEYDLAVVTAQKVSNEMLERYNATITKYDEFKLEVVEQDNCVEFDQLSGYDDGVIVIKGENAEGYDDYTFMADNLDRMEKTNVARKRTRKKLKVERLQEDDGSEHWGSVEVVEKKCQRLFKCQECKIEFEDKSQYREHIRSHDMGSKEMHVCDVCGQTYKSKTALAIHVDLHKGVSPHKCEVCGKKFTQKGALVRHMPIHTGERPYQCDKCGKQFIHYSSFHMHQLAHDNIREKKCSICGLELRSNSHLTRHLRVHSGEKPYSCPTCGQKFAQRYNMTTHLKAHQGIHRTTNKIHSCPVCPVTFNKLPKLAEHMSTAHNMKMELPAARSNRVQIKSQTSKNNASLDADANLVSLVSDVDLVSNYAGNVGDNFIGIMEIKNEFAANVQ